MFLFIRPAGQCAASKNPKGLLAQCARASALELELLPWTWKRAIVHKPSKACAASIRNIRSVPATYWEACETQNKHSCHPYNIHKLVDVAYGFAYTNPAITRQGGHDHCIFTSVMCLGLWVNAVVFIKINNYFFFKRKQQSPTNPTPECM